MRGQDFILFRECGVSEEDIIKANPGSETVIRIGRATYSIVKIKFQPIEKVQTLYRLSVENNVSVKEIMDANPGLSAELPNRTGHPCRSYGSCPLTATIRAAGQELPKRLPKQRNR